MGKETLIIFLGAWVAVQSFLGFPLGWDMVIYAILGIIIVGLGVMMQRELVMRRGSRARHTEAFVENAPQMDSVSEVVASTHEEEMDDMVRG